MISRDLFKEAIYAAIEPGDSVSAKTLGAASAAAVWSVLEGCPVGAIVDTWVNPTRGDGQLVKAALARLGIAEVYEVLCLVPPDLAVSRYARRERGAVHRANEHVLRDIREAAPHIKPLGIGPSLTVDTSVPVDVESVIVRLRQLRPSQPK